MWNILVPIEESELLPSILKCASLCTGRLGTYVEGMPLRPDLVSVAAFAGMGGAPLILEEDQRADEEALRRAQQTFERFVEESGLTLEGAARTFFRMGAPPGDAFLGEHARAFDITVLGQPDMKAAAPRLATLETILFESGRPILVAPPEPPRSLGDTIVIAWNGSTETARTIAFARPLLDRAQRVVVLSVEGGVVSGPSAEEISRSLKRVGVPAEPLLAPQHHGVGESILAQCRSLEADLLLKGAYTQSRLRQMIFGGATRHILEMAHLPVFMAH